MIRKDDTLALWLAINTGGQGGGGGETWTETKIYENPNPNVAQNEILFNFPESLKGYDFFKCVYKEKIDDANNYISINDVREIGEWDACLTGGISLDNCRRVLIQSNGEMNTLNVYNSLTKTGTTDNTTNIILAIYGIKKG